MADQHGGYRKPAHPAQVSGPGKYSKRTDGKPGQAMSSAPGQDYGQRTADLNAQRVQPLAAAAPTPTLPSGGGAPTPTPVSAPAYQGGAFNAPSDRPDEPITAGTAMPGGAGPEALSAPMQGSPMQPDPQAAPTGKMTAMLQRLSATDTTGIMGQLMQSAQARGA